MRNRNGIVATIATLVLATGASVVAGAGGSANAATLTCGNSCTGIGPQSSGLNNVTAVPDGGAGTTGESVTIARAVESASEDFKLLPEGTVATFYSFGIVGLALDQTWPSDYMYEYEYTPDGVWSNLCLGLATTAADGTAVSLQPCGVSAKTLWMLLSADSDGRYAPLVSGTDTVTSAPYVLTAGGEYAGLTTEQLSLSGGTFSLNQMWASRSGVYYPPVYLRPVCVPGWRCL
jgi:hypothetical protein